MFFCCGDKILRNYAFFVNLSKFYKEDIERLHIKEDRTKPKSIKFCEIEKHIFRKAINIKAKQENSLFQFENLKKEREKLQYTLKDLKDEV